ncbi:hypothetical protein, partial [Chromobacterium haemolyticum]|uniref:hypothetical protein n=1 Tax=Chromobacterium haemolyticum TaxID=394935 RepID=UPI0019654C0A
SGMVKWYMSISKRYSPWGVSRSAADDEQTLRVFQAEMLSHVPGSPPGIFFARVRRRRSGVWRAGFLLIAMAAPTERS